MKIIREERMFVLNSPKLIEHWRKLMRESKTKELKNDIHVLKEAFARAVSRKAAMIKYLIQAKTNRELTSTKVP